MLVGYARVSTQDQDPALQLDALKGAGCEKVFTEKASGAQRDRPRLRAALDYMRSGDTLVVWKLDRLARSLKQLIETVEDLGDRGIGLRSLTEFDRHREHGRPVGLPHLRGPGRVRARRHPRAHPGRPERGESPRPSRRAPSGAQGLRPGGSQGLLRDPEITVEDIARRLGVAPSTLYRHLPKARSAVLECEK